jgi:hypothetical protein
VKQIGYKVIVVVILLLNSTLVLSQSNIWQDVNLSARSSNESDLSHYFDADDEALRRKLNLAPNEVRGVSDVIELPMPDGSLAKFSIVESSIMEDGLAQEFPQIKSYKVYGIDDPSASGRVDISPAGLRGMLMTSQGRVFIDPVDMTSRYESSFRNDGAGRGSVSICSAHMLPKNDDLVRTNLNRSATLNRIPGSLITYRLAVSATSEYVDAVGGTLITAMAAINTAINRVNQIYERDLGVRLVLVATNSSIIEVFPDDFSFTNNDDFVLLDENQFKIDAAIGTEHYDIGHIFSTSGGGLASSAVVCESGYKAQGVTGAADPIGDGFYIDFVAHEIGHQFGAEHTFNGGTGSCGGNRNRPTAYEPGSGSTIMSYAGICDGENIAINSDATFHAGSIVEINSFVTGAGSICGVNSAIPSGNSDPTEVSAGSDHTIPSHTAFRLSGSAVDADASDTLTYQWDQMDPGTTATTSGTIGTDLGNNPLFRSHIPQPTGIRDFPALNTQVNGATEMSARGETLPTTERTLNFRLTARDGRSGQGTDDVKVTVVTTGPFKLTSHNSSLAGNITANMPVTVTWDVAGTLATPVSCPEVDIKLLTFSADGGTYAITELLSQTLNDGSESVTTPDMNSSKARFYIGCNNNIFYDISDNDQNITGGASDFPTTGNSINIYTAANVAPTANAGIDQSVTATATVTLTGTGSSDSDGSLASYAWTQSSGTSVSLSSSSAESPTFDASIANDNGESLVFSLIVTDNEGASSSADTVSIAVAELPNDDTTTTTVPSTSSGGGGLANAALLIYWLTLLVGGYWLRTQKISSGLVFKLTPW